MLKWLGLSSYAFAIMRRIYPNELLPLLWDPTMRSTEQNSPRQPVNCRELHQLIDPRLEPISTLAFRNRNAEKEPTKDGKRTTSKIRKTGKVISWKTRD